MNIILMGGGKYAGLLCSMFSRDYNIIGYLDDVSSSAYIKDIYNIKYLGRSDEARSLLTECPNMAIAIGTEGDLAVRIKYFNFFKSIGFNFPSLVHSSSHIAARSYIGDGTVVQYNALIHPCVKIGNNCVISSGAIIGHDSVIGDNVYIGPGSIINGSVTIGDETFIGTGSIVIQKKNIGKQCKLAAASCVIADAPDFSFVRGVPARYTSLVADA